VTKATQACRAPPAAPASMARRVTPVYPGIRDRKVCQDRKVNQDYRAPKVTQDQLDRLVSPECKETLVNQASQDPQERKAPQGIQEQKATAVTTACLGHRAETVIGDLMDNLGFQGSRATLARQAQWDRSEKRAIVGRLASQVRTAHLAPLD